MKLTLLLGAISLTLAFIGYFSCDILNALYWMAFTILCSIIYLIEIVRQQ